MAWVAGPGLVPGSLGHRPSGSPTRRSLHQDKTPYNKRDTLLQDRPPARTQSHNDHVFTKRWPGSWAQVSGDKNATNDTNTQKPTNKNATKDSANAKSVSKTTKTNRKNSKATNKKRQEQPTQETAGQPASLAGLARQAWPGWPGVARPAWPSQAGLAGPG